MVKPLGLIAVGLLLFLIGPVLQFVSITVPFWVSGLGALIGLIGAAWFIKEEML